MGRLEFNSVEDWIASYYQNQVVVVVEWPEGLGHNWQLIEDRIQQEPAKATIPMPYLAFGYGDREEAERCFRLQDPAVRSRIKIFYVDESRTVTELKVSPEET